jgi:hypothetical protein
MMALEQRFHGRARLPVQFHWALIRLANCTIAQLRDNVQVYNFHAEVFKTA